MNNKDKVKGFDTPGAITDSLTELLRQGARGLIKKAVETELQFFLSQYENVTDVRGRKTVVRNGYLPEREVLYLTSTIKLLGGPPHLIRYRYRYSFNFDVIPFFKSHTV